MDLRYDEVLVRLIKDADQKAFGQLFREHDEQFYYCSLTTTGECHCPVISAWSKEEALERVAGSKRVPQVVILRNNLLCLR